MRELRARADRCAGLAGVGITSGFVVVRLRTSGARRSSALPAARRHPLSDPATYPRELLVDPDHESADFLDLCGEDSCDDDGC